jgi:heptosyltransferase II
MKIIINALSGNGDALMFSPSLKILKERFPHAEIDMLAMFKSVKQMYSNCPHLNNIFFIDFLRQSKFKSLGQISNIRKRKYDIGINVYPANRYEYNVLNFLLGAKQRISHHYVHTKPSRMEWLNTTLVNEINDRHNVLQNLDLIKQLTDVSDSMAGGLEIFLSDEDKNKASEWIREINPGNNILVGFHAGSSTLKNHIHKRWDADKYAEVGRILMNEYGAKILLFGIEHDVNNRIHEKLNGETIIASTSNYMDSMARMEHCRLFISNDTAFMHSAAAFKIPTIAIFAYTNYLELYPWQTEHFIVRRQFSCSPCFYNSPKPVECIWKGEDEFKCIRQISVGEVMNAAHKLLT